MANIVRYGATYPKITIDHDVNYPNAQFNIKTITVEEWNDVLHHTHRQSEILDNNGEFIGENGGSLVNNEDFIELKELVSSLVEQNRELLSRIEVLETANQEDDGSITIGDWDAEAPGVQTSPEADSNNG